MKIKIENRKKNEIMNDIETCLNYIDNYNIKELNSKWRVELDDDLLNNLKVAKDFLMNLFQEKLTDDIFGKINNTVVKKIFRACKLIYLWNFQIYFNHMFWYNMQIVRKRGRREKNDKK